MDQDQDPVRSRLNLGHLLMDHESHEASRWSQTVFKEFVSFCQRIDDLQLQTRSLETRQARSTAIGAESEKGRGLDRLKSGHVNTLFDSYMLNVRFRT